MKHVRRMIVLVAVGRSSCSLRVGAASPARAPQAT